MIHRSDESEVEIPVADVTSFVFEHADQYPDKPALIDGPTGRALTYAELRNQIRALGAGLTERGFERGDVLAVFMPNGPEYAVAFHGVAAIGGKCTTVNPLYTAKELAHQLADSGARMLLTVPAFLESALEAAEQAGIADEVYVVGEAEGATAFADLLGDPDAAPDPAIEPQSDLAVLPYSSGTTGLPKGVMLTHHNLVANLCQLDVGFPITEDDTLIGVLPFFHIYGMVVIMNQGLRSGATIVTMPRFDLDQFLSLTAEHGATRIYVVPPIALALAKHPAVDGHDLSSVQVTMSGAAPLGAELADRVAGRIDCKVIQGYGLTETSPVTHVIRPAGKNKPGSIGPPLVNTECRLVDPESGEDVGCRRARRALDPRPPGDEGLSQQRGSDDGDRRRGRLATYGRRGRRRRGRLLHDRRPAQGADQVQGLPGRSGRARGPHPGPSSSRRRRGDRHPRRGMR